MKTNENVVVEEYTVIPLLPEVNKPYLVDGQYWMKSIYYGDSMQPGLQPGDRMILREKPIHSSFNGDIYMIQIGDTSNAFMCRLYNSEKMDHIRRKTNNPRHGEQDIPINLIVGIWELISSHRVHSFSYATVQLPIFQS